jgi:putative toxin-antitoxin system antitoxin component (TIGR02293 family)
MAPAVKRVSPKQTASSPTRSRPQRGLSLVAAAQQGIPKTKASQLVERIAKGSDLPVGKLRAEIIPDSSWKRSGETLRPTASQTALRLAHVLDMATGIWGNEHDAVTWFNTPHPELHAATPYSLLRTEAGGRAVESVLIALEHGFPV